MSFNQHFRNKNIFLNFFFFFTEASRPPYRGFAAPHGVVTHTLKNTDIEELEEKLNLQLRRLKNSKAPGIDGVTNEFYLGAPTSLKTEI